MMETLLTGQPIGALREMENEIEEMGEIIEVLMNGDEAEMDQLAAEYGLFDRNVSAKCRLQHLLAAFE